MDPLTAAFQFMAAVAKAYATFIEGATPEQKQQLVADWLETAKFWRQVLDRLQPKA